MNYKVILICVLQILICCVGFSQEQVQLTPTEKKQRTVVTEPQTLYKGFWRVGSSFGYSTVDKIFDPDGKKISLPSNIWGSSWLIQTWVTYGINDRFQVEVLIPYKFENLYQSVLVEFPDGNQMERTKWKNTVSGLSDISVSASYQLLTEKINRPSLTAYLTGVIPTGEKNLSNVNPDNPEEYDAPAGYGEPSVSLTLRMRKVIYPYSYSFFVTGQMFAGGKKILEPTDEEESPFKSGPNFSGGGSFSFHLNDWIAVVNNLDYFFSGKDEYDGVMEDDNSWVVQYYPGLSFQAKQFRISQTVTIPVAGKFVSADPSYLLVLQYTF